MPEQTFQITPETFTSIDPNEARFTFFKSCLEEVYLRLVIAKEDGTDITEANPDDNRLFTEVTEKLEYQLDLSSTAEYTEFEYIAKISFDW